MSKGDTWENDFLKLTFNATAIANIADNAAASPLTQLFVALHVADPNATPETGFQNTSEIAYTGYARVAVNRNSGGWTVTGNSVSPAAAITFGACTVAGTSPATHFSVGTATSGAGKLLYSGPVTPNIAVTAGVTPQLTTASTVTED
jgi:hypothetical protein